MDVAGKEFYASGGAGRQVKLGNEIELRPAATARTGVKIVSGTVRNGGHTESARSYERMLTVGDRAVGRVRVFLSAETIQRVKREQTQRATWIIVIAASIAIAVVTLVGGWLARPIGTLKRDMAMVAAGDLFHQSSIRTGDELDELAGSFNRMTSQLAEAQEREIERKALERELSIATTIQQALLPEAVPEIPGYEVAAHYQSAREVGPRSPAKTCPMKWRPPIMANGPVTDLIISSPFRSTRA